ncbi:MAG: hypothetical protein WCK75_02095 [Elusimicrobiota bacterium]
METKNVRQIKGDPPRRWFSDSFFDLIVWQDTDKSIWGFQLCYDLEVNPRALTWTKVQSYSHSGIDDGEGASGAHKSSPILVQDGLFDPKGVSELLIASAGDLPKEILSFVTEKLDNFKICASNGHKPLYDKI